ncbi:hypothetical protein A2Z22_03710 [Candidatus Woesebacteria bacterium RBG_16_34_12]|uniref:Uncharacterized protein n=1 Tax=Candidatus Woesebacteria bacterium RBG_16_34_12 TaxID=1802480 RepID=A0A1F7X7C1_9BACT|nr:MAG: hypothetical protein A2Z22_03710 [Candidatus Woesebacteria bacterium RBG_16_34_12]
MSYLEINQNKKGRESFEDEPVKKGSFKLKVEIGDNSRDYPVTDLIFSGVSSSSLIKNLSEVEKSLPIIAFEGNDEAVPSIRKCWVLVNYDVVKEVSRITQHIQAISQDTTGERQFSLCKIELPRKEFYNIHELYEASEVSPSIEIEGKMRARFPKRSKSFKATVEFSRDQL